MDFNQILGIIIFGAMFAVIIWDRCPRPCAALVGAVLMIGGAFPGVMQSKEGYAISRGRYLK